MQSTEKPRFVSIHLAEPSRIQVIHLAHLVTLDVRPESSMATANLSDGSQVRGTMHQMWPLLEVAGLQAHQVDQVEMQEALEPNAWICPGCDDEMPGTATASTHGYCEVCEIIQQAGGMSRSIPCENDHNCAVTSHVD